MTLRTWKGTNSHLQVNFDFNIKQRIISFPLTCKKRHVIMVCKLYNFCACMSKHQISNTQIWHRQHHLKLISINLRSVKIWYETREYEFQIVGNVRSKINHQPVNKSVQISLWIVAFSTESLELTCVWNFKWIWYFILLCGLDFCVSDLCYVRHNILTIVKEIKKWNLFLRESYSYIINFVW